LLACVGPTGANDSNDFFVALGVDDDHESPLDGADRDEAILEVGVLDVEGLQVIDTRFEEPTSLPERDAVLLLVEQVLGIVPLEAPRSKSKPLTD
jgi:hypothetical protein